MLLCEDGTLLTREAPRGNVVNPVGAGDAMVAGFIYGWLAFPFIYPHYRSGHNYNNHIMIPH